MLRVCVETIERFTPEPHELWIVDNNSPAAFTEAFMDRAHINLVLNRTEPLPPEARRREPSSEAPASQKRWGSYANAIALELGVRLIDPDSRYIVTLHMDVMPCRDGWLSFLLSKLNRRTAAAGARMDRTRHPAGALHVLGMLIDFKRFRDVKLDFFPNLPEFDVGDRVTIALRDAGFEVFACRNTLWEPSLLESAPANSPFRDLPVDRAVNDADEPIFLHLGRGVRKSVSEYAKGLTVEEWVDFGDRVLLGRSRETPRPEVS